MAGTVTVTQAYNLGTLSWQGGALTYVVACTPDAGTGVYPTQAEVVTAVQAAVPANLAMIGTNGYLLPLDDVKLEHVTDALWLVEATFKRPQPRDKLPESNGPVIDFDTTGGTQHIVVSKAYQSYVPGGGTVRDVKGVIGDDGKRVNGVDIGYAVYRFSEEWTLPDTSVPSTPGGGIAATACTTAYRATLKALTFRTNSAAFRGFAIGEVLFEGATGRRVKGGAFDVTYKFAVSPNATNLAVGDITVSSKGGWQYLDVRMKDSANADRVVQVPAQATVHTVYDAGDFSQLAIGTGAL
jgi:hypothetical protein